MKTGKPMMAMVYSFIAAKGGPMAQVRRLRPRVGGRLALFCIHRVNRVYGALVVLHGHVIGRLINCRRPITIIIIVIANAKYKSATCTWYICGHNSLNHPSRAFFYTVTPSSAKFRENMNLYQFKVIQGHRTEGRAIA